VRFLVYAHASCDETEDHWETLFETGSLQDEELYRQIHARLEALSKSINKFIDAVEREHRSLREEHGEYTASAE
jgi:four helix bundle protein